MSEAAMFKVMADKRKREIVGWLASGVAAIVAGIWAFYVHVYDAPSNPANINSKDCSIAAGNNLSARDISVSDCHNQRS
jgi:hypothetical protein